MSKNNLRKFSNTSIALAGILVTIMAVFGLALSNLNQQAQSASADGSTLLATEDADDDAELPEDSEDETIPDGTVDSVDDLITEAESTRSKFVNLQRGSIRSTQIFDSVSRENKQLPLAYTYNSNNRNRPEEGGRAGINNLTAMTEQAKEFGEHRFLNSDGIIAVLGRREGGECLTGGNQLILWERRVELEGAHADSIRSLRDSAIVSGTGRPEGEGWTNAGVLGCTIPVRTERSVGVLVDRVPLYEGIISDKDGNSSPLNGKRIYTTDKAELRALRGLGLKVEIKQIANVGRVPLARPVYMYATNNRFHYRTKAEPFLGENPLIRFAGRMFAARAVRPVTEASPNGECVIEGTTQLWVRELAGELIVARNKPLNATLLGCVSTSARAGHTPLFEKAPGGTVQRNAYFYNTIDRRKLGGSAKITTEGNRIAAVI